MIMHRSATVKLKLLMAMRMNNNNINEYGLGRKFLR
jgi:hypothetical protein